MVLVVDDHPDTGRVISRLLERSGYVATYVTSGRDALAVVSGQLPKLVVLDVMMPDMNGIDVLRAIRSDACYDNVSVLMYSADHTHSRMTEAMRAGAQGYLVKGTVGWDDLLAEVRRLA